MSSELRATLAISRSEALSGTNRTLTLPGGRKVTVVVPAGAYDGQVIRVEGQDYDDSANTLLLTLAVIEVETTTVPPDPNQELPTIAASSPYVQNPLISSPTPIPYYQNPSTSTPNVYAQNPLTAPPPPNLETPTTAAPSTNPQQIISPPFYAQQESTIAPPPPPPSQGAPVLVSPPGRRENVVSRSPLAQGRTILLVGIALLVIVGGLGLFFVFRANQARTNNTSATATAQIGATVTANAFNATATTQAGSVAATSVAFNATATVQAQASATAAVIAANPDPYGGGTLALYDPLHDNNSGYNWGTGTDNTGSSCKFTGGTYHVSESNINKFYSCSASPVFSNFAFEVKMTIINGYAGGMVFRADPSNTKFYLLVVGQDGSYSLYLYVDNIASDIKTLTSGSSSAIHQGLGQTNVIAVVAQGSSFTVYVNRQQITNLNDSTFSHGQVGVVAYPNNTSTEVAYSNAKVWTL